MPNIAFYNNIIILLCCKAIREVGTIYLNIYYYRLLAIVKMFFVQ